MATILLYELNSGRFLNVSIPDKTSIGGIMRKSLMSLLMLSLVASLVSGCGGSSDSNSTTATTVSVASTTTAVATSTTAAATTTTAAATSTTATVASTTTQAAATTTTSAATPTTTSTTTTTTLPSSTAACGSCHAIPPATGQHSFHVSSRGIGCATCHGTGYSSTAYNAATHANGTKNVATTIGWNSTLRSCSNSCHGNKSW